MSDDKTERELLESALREHVRGMSEEDFRTFVVQVRPPNSVEQLKGAAANVLSGDQLDAFLSVADPKAFDGEDGDIDDEKVVGRLTAMFGTGEQRQFGRGERGRAEAARRFGGQSSGARPPDDGPGAGGRAEAARRFGTGGKQ
ncbi:MAG: hypothetical protein ACRET2_17685 [Steroidobacteraceae bacterium]